LETKTRDGRTMDVIRQIWKLEGFAGFYKTCVESVGLERKV